MIKKISLITVFSLLLNICALSLPTVSFADYSPAVSGSEEYTWANVPVGAGGFVTGMAIHPTESDLVYCRTDVGGAYRWDVENSVWIPLMDEFPYEWVGLYGIDGIALDKNNPDIVYVAAGGAGGLCDVLKSTDRGNTWQRTNFEGAVFDGNGEHRGMGECIAVDPNSSNIIYAGTFNNGLWKSTDSGESWQKVYDSYSPMRNVIFDESTVISGNTRVYAGIIDGGLIMSDNGGASWTNIDGAPDKINRMTLNSDGSILYAASDTGLFKYDGTSWTEISPPENEGLIYNAVTLDKADENNIMCLGPETDSNFMKVPMWYSTDGGSTWVNKTETSTLTSSLPWDQKEVTADLAANAHDLIIDPHNSNRVWMSDWFGVYKTETIKADAQRWEFLYYGMEEVCPRKIISPETGDYRLIAAIADMDGAKYTDYKKYPTVKIRDGVRVDPPKWTWMMSSADIDYCVCDPNIMIRVGIDWNTEAKAEITLDGTKTWKHITFINKNTGEQYPEFSQFGQAAVSATKNPKTGKPSIVVIPSNHVPIVSDDLGETWEDVEGITDTTISTHYWNRGRHLASDRVDGSTFYIQDRNNSTTNMSKTYVSHDFGHTWTHTATLGTKNVPWHVDHTQIKSAPYIKGEVWAVSGDRKLCRSSDSGETFKAFSNITNVECFCFGKNAPDNGNPTVYAYGSVRGVYGIYRSIDMGLNWCRLDLNTRPSACTPNDISADMRTFGIVYISAGGRGIFYGEPVEQTVPENTPKPTIDPSTALKKNVHENLNDDADWSGYGFTMANPSWGQIKYDNWGNGRGQYIYDKYTFADDFTFCSNQLNVYANTADMLFCYQDDDNYYKLTLGDETRLTKVVNGVETVLSEISEQTKGELSVKITHSSDGKITVTKGEKGQNGAGTELISVTDTDLIYGKIGLKSAGSGGYFASMYVDGTAIFEAPVVTLPPMPSPTAMPSPSPTPVMTLAPIYTEDFDSITNANKALWVNTGAAENNLEIANGVIKGDDWRGTAVMLYKGTFFYDETLSFSVDMSGNWGSSKSNAASALINYSAEENSYGIGHTGYAVEIQGSNDGGVLLRKYNGNLWNGVEIIASYTPPVSLYGKNIKVDVFYEQGGFISADITVDGVKYRAFDNVKDTDYISGYTGVMKTSSAFTYDNVTISAMVEAPVYSIKNAAFTQNGGSVNVSADITKGTENAKIYTALYDENQRLIAVKSIDSSELSSEEFTVDIPAPSDVSKTKIMIWNDMQALCSAEIIE